MDAMQHPKMIAGRFQPGAPGRPPGAVSAVQKVHAICKKLGFNPIEEAIRMFRDPATRPGPRAQYLQMVVDRYAPKLKAVEHSGATKDIQQVLINVLAAPNTNATSLEHTVNTLSLDNPETNSVEYQEVSTPESDS